jgi:hypothetical protein
MQNIPYLSAIPTASRYLLVGGGLCPVKPREGKLLSHPLDQSVNCNQIQPSF